MTRLIQRTIKTVTLVTLLFLISTPVFAGPINQWASSVVSFSSQYAQYPPWNWGAIQATGAPNTFNYGESPRAWAPRNRNISGGQEYITLGFTTPVSASGVVVRESLGNGFVYQVELTDTLGNVHVVWNGQDTSQPGSVVDFLVSFAQTPYLVSAVTIRIKDTWYGWEEIDAVQLIGNVPETGSTVLLLGIGLLGLAAFRLRP
jgi:hypothetical protein